MIRKYIAHAAAASAVIVAGVAFSATSHADEPTVPVTASPAPSVLADPDTDDCIVITDGTVVFGRTRQTHQRCGGDNTGVPVIVAPADPLGPTASAVAVREPVAEPAPAEPVEAVVVEAPRSAVPATTVARRAARAETAWDYVRTLPV